MEVAVTAKVFDLEFELGVRPEPRLVGARFGGCDPMGGALDLPDW